MRAVILETTPLEAHIEKTRTASSVLRFPRVRVQEVPKPTVGATDILIRVRACGICGSDVAMASQDERNFTRYPFMMASSIIPGHEFAGEVVEMGGLVHEYWPDLEVGEPVTAQCVLNCGLCPSCKIGEFDNCLNADELGFTRNGGMAEYCVADMRHVWSLKSLQNSLASNANLFMLGSLVEPHAGVYKAIIENGFQPGENVLIIGAGPIGLAATSVFKALGAGQIVVVDPSSPRLVLASTLGANTVINPEGIRTSLLEHVLFYTKDRGISCIFEASGVAEKNWGLILSLMECARTPPRLVFFGQSKEEIAINPQLFIQNFARFSGSHGHTKVWPTIIDLFANGRINPLPMLTRRITLDEVPHWLEVLTTNKQEGKVTVTLP